MNDQLGTAILLLQLAVLTCSSNERASHLCGAFLCLQFFISYALNFIGYELIIGGANYAATVAVFFTPDIHFLLQSWLVVLFLSLAATLRLTWLCFGYGVIFLFIFVSYFSLAFSSSFWWWVVGYNCELLLILMAFKNGKFDGNSKAHSYGGNVNSGSLVDRGGTA